MGDSGPSPAPSREGPARHFSGSPYEAKAGFCRALRHGDRILVAGTAPIGPDGATVAPGDAATQMRCCLQIVAGAVAALGGQARDIVRTRIFLVDAADWPAVSQAHGEFFAHHPPVATCVVVKALLDPSWRVELEAEAITSEGG
ncbi:RidA family protein [bacterium]|nr:RidA family protein [bacterium]